MSRNSKPASLLRNRGPVTVAASPFNAVKLELGIVLVLGLLSWLALGASPLSDGVQLLVLAGYGALGMLWLLGRTRAVFRAVRHAAAVPRTGAGR